MTNKTQFRWEQDGAGGEHGTEPYWPGTIYETTVPTPTHAPIESINMTARKTLELAAIILLPGVLLYGACAFVSLEWDFREWSAAGRLAMLSIWVALAIPLVIAWEKFRAWEEFR